MDFFDRVEEELRAAALPNEGRRRGHLRRRWLTALALAGLVLVIAGAALAATGQLGFGPPLDPLAGPGEETLGGSPAQRGRLLAVRTPDPVGGPPWGIRTFRSRRGDSCAQYGRVVAGRLVALERGGRPRELRLRCLGHARPGQFGFGSAEASGALGPVSGDVRTLFYGYVGARARQVILERRGGGLEPPRMVLPVRDGAYLAVYRGVGRSFLLDPPRITVVLDDGTVHPLEEATAAAARAARPRPPTQPPIRRVRVSPKSTSIAPDEPLTVRFRAPLPIRDASFTYRAEANGPHRRGCAGRAVAGTTRPYRRGQIVAVRLAPVRWCRGRFEGRVALNIRRTIGRFTVRVR